ncbi:MAG: SRPBCC family protein [Nitrospinales bacterium]
MIIENKILIDASQELIWEATIDIESWPTWWPGMEKIVREDNGGFDVGSSALIKQKFMPETRWVVTEMNPGYCFTWITNNIGIEMIATHKINSNAAEVSSTLKVEMNGLLVSLLGFLIKDPIAKSLKDENLALKKYCESKT